MVISDPSDISAALWGRIEVHPLRDGAAWGGPGEPSAPPYSFAGASAASAPRLALLSVAGSRVGDKLGVLWEGGVGRGGAGGSRVKAGWAGAGQGGC